MTASKPTGGEPPLLRVRDLKTYFDLDAGTAKAVDGVSFDVHKGDVLGIVGESGSGKSVTALSVLRLIPHPPGRIAGGSIQFRGQELLDLSYPEMRKIRGSGIAMVFQEPMTALNPVLTVGSQITETLRTHEKISAREAFDRGAKMLERVGIPDARKRMKEYPHQFSGGMRQRAMIAIALVCHPAILIADEPTTALDVTIQAQILDLMLELKEQQGASILLITHDLAVVAETCHRVLVMYGGKVQEVATTNQLFDLPAHPYTQGLLRSLPSVADSSTAGDRSKRLQTIPGNVPAILELPSGCKFCTRCPEVFDRCRTEEPELYDIGDGHLVRCFLHDPAGSGKTEPAVGSAAASSTGEGAASHE